MGYLRPRLWWVTLNFKGEIMKVRNFHKLAIVRREARGNTTTVPSKKVYRRKVKHLKRFE